MGEGFFLGLATGGYCLATCLPVAVPFLFSEAVPDLAANLRLVLLFLLGRLTAYTIFGFAVGFLGGLAAQAAPAPLPVGVVAGTNIVLGLIMLASGLFQNFPGWKICHWYRGVYSPDRGALAYGLLTGLNVCPPFLTAAAQVFGKGGAWDGMFYFMWFFAGTSVYFLPLLGVSFLQRQERSLRAVGRWVLVLMGAYVLLGLGVLPLVVR